MWSVTEPSLVNTYEVDYVMGAMETVWLALAVAQVCAWRARMHVNALLEPWLPIFYESVGTHLQALCWFFLLPAALKPVWEGFWSGLSPLYAQLLLNVTGFFYFFAYAVVMLPIYYAEIPFFEQFKISDQPWAWRSPKEEVRRKFWALSGRSVRYFFVNYGFLVPVLTAGKYFVLGDNMSFSTRDWPSYQTLFLHNMALTLVHEFAFYWSHRIAHIPSLYKYHKVHHEYTQNTILASQHEHPIDYIVTIATPALVAVSVVNPHSVTLFQWIAWILVANIDDHVCRRRLVAPAQPRGTECASLICATFAFRVWFRSAMRSRGPQFVGSPSPTGRTSTSSTTRRT